MRAFVSLCWIVLLIRDAMDVVDGMKCLNCFPCCRLSRQTPNRKSFMDFNQSKSERNRHDTRFLNTQSEAYQSCQVIINHLPWIARSRKASDEDRLRDRMLPQCIERWQELMGEITLNSWHNYRPPQSRSVITNLVIFKLNGGIMDTRNVQTHLYRLQMIRDYNKRDLAFNPIPHSKDDSKKLAIYRRGFMELLHTMRSGRVMDNTFDLALFGDGDQTTFDMVYHAVAIEVYYNQYYLKMVERGLYHLSAQRLEELQINFKFAICGLPPRVPMDQYNRVLIVDPEYESRALSLGSSAFGIMIKKFWIASREISLRHWYHERNGGDGSLARFQELILDIDTKLIGKAKFLNIKDQPRIACNLTTGVARRYFKKW